MFYRQFGSMKTLTPWEFLVLLSTQCWGQQPACPPNMWLCHINSVGQGPACPHSTNELLLKSGLPHFSSIQWMCACTGKARPRHRLCLVHRGRGGALWTDTSPLISPPQNFLNRVFSYYNVMSSVFTSCHCQMFLIPSFCYLSKLKSLVSP